jgi:hypothetical protein
LGFAPAIALSRKGDLGGSVTGTVPHSCVSTICARRPMGDSVVKGDLEAVRLVGVKESVEVIPRKMWRIERKFFPR